MTTYLTHAELKALTGADKLTLQIEWLRDHRWLFEVARSGEPRVARAYWQRRMVGGAADDAHAEAAPALKVVHNFAALGKSDGPKLEGRDRLEVTPEMVAAGVSVYFTWDDDDDPSSLVASVFDSMFEVWRQQTRLDASSRQ